MMMISKNNVLLQAVSYVHHEDGSPSVKPCVNSDIPSMEDVSALGLSSQPVMMATSLDQVYISSCARCFVDDFLLAPPS